MKRLTKSLMGPFRSARAGAEDQDEPPNRLTRENFPTGIKRFCSPEDSTVEYAAFYLDWRTLANVSRLV
jgi:hypothetical protein